MNHLKKYLPSKQFSKIMISSMAVILVVFLIFYFASKKESFKSKNEGNGLAVGEQTVLELIEADTDLDSIPDWEEALWGTNKNKPRTFDDTPDGVYIENRKKELNIEQEQNDKTLTETEQFAREFFTAYTALKASGQVDDEAINNFSNAIGQKVVNPDLIDRYTEDQAILTNTDDTTEKENYYETVKKIFDGYRKAGLGEELDIVNKGLIDYSSTGGNADYQKLATISTAYREFAEKVMKVSVPRSLLEYHIRIANSSNNLSISVGNMIKVINDPIIGLSGLSQYQKYSGDLVKAVEDLENALE